MVHQRLKASGGKELSMKAEGCALSGAARLVEEDEKISIREIELRILLCFSESPLHTDQVVGIKSYIVVAKPVGRNS